LPAALHARSALAVVESATRYAADVRVMWRGRVADARSLTALLALEASAADVLDITGTGREAREAVRAVVQALSSGAEAQRYALTALSPGRALGVARVLRRPGHERATGSAAPLDEAHELRRLDEAFQRAEAELAEQIDNARASGQASVIDILETCAAVLRDGELRAWLLEAVSGGLAAAAAVEQRWSLRDGPADSPLSEALADWRQRLRQQLVEAVAPPEGGPIILVGERCTPADLWPDVRLAGIVVMQGGTASHCAIIARSRGLPMVAGLPERAMDAIVDGQALLVDG